MVKKDPREILKGEIQKFLTEFELSKETEGDMKTLLPIWRNDILSHAQEVGGKIYSEIKVLIDVCEDYANYRGILGRVRQEAEEVRIQLNL